MGVFIALLIVLLNAASLAWAQPGECARYANSVASCERGLALRPEVRLAQQGLGQAEKQLLEEAISEPEREYSEPKGSERQRWEQERETEAPQMMGLSPETKPGVAKPPPVTGTPGHGEKTGGQP